MNYRHAFHAGNFADLVKHAALTLLLGELTASPAPLSVIDTHAGAGMYDLGGAMAERSGEAKAGIVRLMDAPEAPAVFADLVAAVHAVNPGGGVRFYPGSPTLISRALRKSDRYTACELRDDDVALLRRTLGPYPFAKAVQADGYATAAAGTASFVLIDPPFERPDDYARIADTLRAVKARSPQATVAVWLPLKDLETFDAFLRGIDETASGALVAEARLRPLTNPMKMNGCAMVIANPPKGVAGPLATACEWVVSALGDTGGQAKLWNLP